VPLVHPVQSLPQFLRTGLARSAAGVDAPPTRFLLSLQAGASHLRGWAGMADPQPVIFLSGPEGGFSPAEEALAIAAGFTPQSLGARTLRAETAAVAALALLA
jgi:16S rRNA (uracil1498-N3)-methyltransferase